MTFDDYSYNYVNEAIFDMFQKLKTEEPKKKEIAIEDQSSVFDDEVFKDSASEDGKDTKPPPKEEEKVG